MTNDTLKYISEISNELKNLHGDDYGEQFCNRVMHVINNNPADKTDYQIIFEGVYSLIDSDYKDKLIFNLQKKIKEQDARIRTLETEVDSLKKDGIVKEKKISNLEKTVSILMRNHHLIVIAQAYKNLEYYIIRKVTGYDSRIMESINTNLNEFLSNENYQSYHEEVTRLMAYFEMEKYHASLSKIRKARNTESHPDPIDIDIDELKDACESLKTKYPGIERFCEGYLEINDVLTN